MADIGSLLGGLGVGGNIGKAIVQLELETTKYQAELKGMQAQTVASTNSSAGAFSKFGGIANAALLGVGAAAVIGLGFAVKAAIDAEKAMAQTEAVLKSTGGTANVTANDVLALADRLRDLTGVDDEVIQASSNLLLTFRDIRNEVGQGNDIFNQSQTAILDMATAMNEGAIPSSQDLHSATIQLGKALNNPIQGMSALRRVGVSFTEAQVEQITRMQEAGDLMGAQKLILHELSLEFGGAAEAAGNTFAGQLAKLQSHLGDVAEEVGQSIIPALEHLVEVIEALIPLVDFLAKGIQFLPLIQMAENLDSDANAVEKLANAMIDSIPVLGHYTDVSKTIGDELGLTAAAMLDNKGLVETLSDAFRDRLVPAVDDTTKQVVKFAHKTSEEIREWSVDTKEAFDDFIFSLEESEDVSAETAHGFQMVMQSMVLDARDLARAMTTISKEKWINDEFITFISEQGPEWLIGFSKLTEDQQRKAQDAWQITTDKTDKAKESLDKITGVLDKLDKGESKHKVIIEYEYAGFDSFQAGDVTASRQGGRGALSGLDVEEQGTTLVEEVAESLERFDGSKTRVVVEIEYRCVGGATPAAAKCIAYVFARFGPMPIGVCAVRNIAGTSIPSQHSFCNAVDFMCSGEKHRQVAFFINANRGPLSIHWLGADPYFPSPLGNHYTHVHADFYPQGPF